ncbi:MULTISPECIES: PaaI family thioesterase [Gammaproteobacteria]|uniref:PaaI family thioesterase n=1 Tax=Gammaproteobacteria TaxID=1236 RepID=UPI00112745F8|nr:PaaI family thioesterase [Pseudomonas sp. Hp2]
MKRDNLFWKMVSGELPLPNAGTMLGWKFIDYDEENREIHVEFDATASFTNPLGHIQGGILSAMLDDTMGPAVYATMPINRMALTVESKTNFVNPARPGKIRGIGRLDHAKGGISFTSGRLLDPAGKVLATATATFRVSEMRWHGVTIPSPIARNLIERRVARQQP